MSDAFKLWPARAPFVDPQTGLLTSAAVKALGRIAELLGGENSTLPVSFIYVPASGTPYGVVYLNALGELTSTIAPANGQILVGATGAEPALATIAGTSNRVTVVNGANSITLSTPQDIATTSSPTFNDLTLSSLTPYSYAYSSAGGAVNSTATALNGQILIGSTSADPMLGVITGTLNQLTVTNGPGTITLSLPQNIHTAATPTFQGLTLSGLSARGFAYVGASSVVSSTAAATNGQLLVGSTGNNPVAATLTGTTNQVTVTNGAGSITLSTPQNLHTAATPTFDSLTLTNGFGCNGKTPQTEVSVNGAISGTATASYTATEQTMLNDLKALTNQLRAALIANGIVV